MIMTQHCKKLKQRIAIHYALFRGDLPFGHKVEKNKKKYNRNSKHKEKLDATE